jgi:hypothetical protein
MEVCNLQGAAMTINDRLSRSRGLLGYTGYDRLVIYPFLGLVFLGLVLVLGAK